MPSTDGRFTQGTSNPDLQFFIGFDDFIDTSAHVTFASGGVGLISNNLAASLAATLFTNVAPYLRTGVLASAAYDQEQFGTAAAQPGPSSVAGTSGPGLAVGFPPFLNSQLPTVSGNQVSGAPAKGIQIDSIDLIYTVTGAALTVATIGLTKTVFVDAVAPAVTNLIALGANGLATAVRATPYVKNVAVAVPAMLTAADTEVVLNVNFTTQAGGSLVFYGAVFHCHYNFN